MSKNIKKNIKKNILKTLACTLSMSSLAVLSPKEAKAAWVSDGANWYYTYDNGNYATGWNQLNGNWYYMWSDGSMAKNTWIESSNDKWYYLTADGSMARNTEINGCYIGDDGAWIITPRGQLNKTDVLGDHRATCRFDLGESERDKQMADTLSTSNISIDSTTRELFYHLTSDLAQEAMYLSEAKNQCLGKTIQGKYMITGIKMFSQEYKNTDCIGVGSEVDVIKQKSNLMNYKSNAQFTYDKYLINSKTVNNIGSEFACFRIVIEFQEV